MAISLRELLEAGAHFGHQTNRWNPKMKPFIFEARKGIYIIDLQKTVKQLEAACKAIEEIASQNKFVLFVGTKKQAAEIVKGEATRCEMPYVSERWLGGTLTNMTTVRKSIERLEYIEGIEMDRSIERFTKKEGVQFKREKERLLKNLSGIRDMDGLPGMIFLIDPEREKIAVHEANKLNIPVAAIIDTNCDPTLITYPIPANDDAIKTISIITSKIADSVSAGTARIREDLRRKKIKREIIAAKEEKREPEKKEIKKAKALKAEKAEMPTINRIKIDTELFSEDIEEKFEKGKKLARKKIMKKGEEVLDEIKRELERKEEKKREEEQKKEEQPKEEQPKAVEPVIEAPVSVAVQEEAVAAKPERKKAVKKVPAKETEAKEKKTAVKAAREKKVKAPSPAKPEKEKKKAVKKTKIKKEE